MYQNSNEGGFMAPTKAQRDSLSKTNVSTWGLWLPSLSSVVSMHVDLSWAGMEFCDHKVFLQTGLFRGSCKAKLR